MSKSNTNSAGHRDRLKQKVRSGIELGKPFYGLYDYEILEYFLFFILPRVDTKPIAKNLLAKFGSISNCFDASLSELTSIDGINEKSALSLISFRELINLYSVEKLSEDEFELKNIEKLLLKLFKNKLDENILLITVNSKDKIINTNFTDKGKRDRVQFDIPKLTKTAIKDSASSVILAHNHPNYSTNPSKEDIINTKELEITLKKVEIKMLDHFIISENDIFSFKKNGLL